jgi:hypothetical protein
VCIPNDASNLKQVKSQWAHWAHWAGAGLSVLSAFSAKTLYKKQQGRKTVLLR